MSNESASAFEQEDPASVPHDFEGDDRRCDRCRLLAEEHPLAVVIATIHSRSFDFEGVGNDEGEARDALLKGLLAHTRQYRLDDGWYEDLLDDTQVRTIWPGRAYRDREDLA